MDHPESPLGPTKLKRDWAYWKAQFVQFAKDYPRLTKAFKIVGGLAGLGFTFILVLWSLVYFGAFGRLPNTADLRAIKTDNASEIYTRDSVLIGKYYVENRILVDNEHMSPFLAQALVATEDARFFQHKGIDLRSWVRVLLRTVLLGDEAGGGGSTISQQLAKNLFPRRRYRILSVPITKFKEMIIARRLEKVYSKEELINLYLNTVPFGGNMYGVEVAANQLFNTSAEDLKLEEAATLVGMLKANTYYSPVRHPERAQGRRNTVLNQMQRYGYLENVLCDSIKQIPLAVNYHRENKHEGLATYFREHLRLDLEEIMSQYRKPDGSDFNIYTDGLKIYTTIDSRMQQYAEEAVAEQMAILQKAFDKHWKKRKPWGNDKVIEAIKKKSRRYKTLAAAGKTEEEINAIFEQPIRMKVFGWEGEQVREMSPLDSIRFYYCLLNAGFAVMEPGDGALRAWVGGIDHQYFQYDHVKSRRQVGSTFKPIVYAAALQKGIEPCEYIENRLVTYTEYDDWRPQNADGEYGGVYSMEGGLRGSVNSVAVDLMMRTGVDTVIDLARQMGVSSAIPEVPAISLGTVDASLYEMLQVYGTFANRGRHQAPYYLTRIENSRGELIAEFQPKAGKQVLSQDEADLMVEIMQSVVDSGTARRLRYQYYVSGDIAGKTGTTQSHADGWFMGFTPKLVAGAWVGGEYPKVRFRSLSLGQGANTALPIWGRFMRKVYKDKSLRSYRRGAFPAPSEEVEMALNCEPYLEEMPIEALLDLENSDSFDEALENLLRSLDNNKSVNVSPEAQQLRRRLEEEKERSKQRERIRKKNEKLERKRRRKKKRKEFWDRLFKKN